MPCRNHCLVRVGWLAALVASAALAGCSDLYLARRETVSPHGGDAMAANRVAQMIDPWPAEAANPNIEANGERSERTIERYRTNRTTPLRTTSTSSVQYQPVLLGTAAGGSGSQ